jgi:hypothetical protein
VNTNFHIHIPKIIMYSNKSSTTSGRSCYYPPYPIPPPFPPPSLLNEYTYPAAVHHYSRYQNKKSEAGYERARRQEAEYKYNFQKGKVYHEQAKREMAERGRAKAVWGYCAEKEKRDYEKSKREKAEREARRLRERERQRDREEVGGWGRRMRSKGW